MLIDLRKLAAPDLLVELARMAIPMAPSKSPCARDAGMQVSRGIA
jgi:hypothetical protein